MPPPKQPAPPPAQCGFPKPDGTLVDEAVLREAVVKEAQKELARWFDQRTKTFQNEGTDARFGDLVRYWMTGFNGKIHPGTLDAAQKAANAPGITYENLGDRTLNAAILRLKGVAKAVDDKSTAVYDKSAAVDTAAEKLKEAVEKTATADDAVKAADKKVRTAGTSVRDAEARVNRAARLSSPAAAAELGRAKEKLREAIETQLTERTTRDEAKRALESAKREHDDAIKARGEARRALDRALPAQQLASQKLRSLSGDKDPALTWDQKNREKVRKQLLKTAGSMDAGNIEEVLRLAHRSRADAEAWSAVFVVSCVRTAALRLGLEAMNSSAAPVGLDGLLKASRKHSDYIVEALERKTRSQDGSYHAFAPGERVVQIGHIIASDRKFGISAREVQGLSERLIGRELHCDIVTVINDSGKGPYAETIGGNIGHTVRRRRYPLHADGKLIVSKDTLVLQEKEDGTFPDVEPQPPSPTRLVAANTRRIIALLCPIAQCRTASKPAPTNKGGRSGKGEEYLGRSADLESPFMNEEILPTELWRESLAGVEWLALQSPFFAQIHRPFGDGGFRDSREERDVDAPPVREEHEDEFPYDGHEQFFVGSPEEEWTPDTEALAAGSPFQNAFEHEFEANDLTNRQEEPEEESGEGDEGEWDEGFGDASLEEESYDTAEAEAGGGTAFIDRALVEAGGEAAREDDENTASLAEELEDGFSLDPSDSAGLDLEENEFRLNLLPPKAQQQFSKGKSFWRQAAAEAILAGVGDPNVLANLIFFMHHADRLTAGVGKPLIKTDPEFLKLRAEWNLYRTIATGLLRPASAAPVYDVFLPANPSGTYEGYVAAPTTGRITLMAHGRNSNGASSSIDETETLESMQAAIESLGPNDSVLLAAWQFIPTALCLTGPSATGMKTRVYTMVNRLVHSKLILVDDQALSMGSANANPRGFFVDTELNVMLRDAEAVKTFRHSLWAHDLGVSAKTVEAWGVPDFIPQWDAVAKANDGLQATPEQMAGEGVVPFDPTTVKGKRSFLNLDILSEI